jgi:hypothetical protein
MSTKGTIPPENADEDGNPKNVDADQADVKEKLEHQAAGQKVEHPRKGV